MISQIHDSLNTIFLRRIRAGDVVMQNKPDKTTHQQKVGVVLEVKRIFKKGVTLKTGNVYWFGIVKHLNEEEEQIVSLKKESTELVLLSGLTILKKGIDE